MICKNCNYTNDDDSKFCMGCGKPLSNPIPAQEILKEKRTKLNSSKNKIFILSGIGIVLAIAAVIFYFSNSETNKEKAETEFYDSLGLSDSTIAFHLLENYTPNELAIIRNSIFAKKGYIFNKGGEMERYFLQKEWYKPTYTNVVQFLNEKELENISRIKLYEDNLDFFEFWKEFKETASTNPEVLFQYKAESFKLDHPRLFYEELAAAIKEDPDYLNKVTIEEIEGNQEWGYDTIGKLDDFVYTSRNGYAVIFRKLNGKYKIVGIEYYS